MLLWRTDADPADRVAILQAEQLRDARHRPLDEVQREQAIRRRQRVPASVVSGVDYCRRGGDPIDALLVRREHGDRLPAGRGRAIGHGRGGADAARGGGVLPSKTRATRVALCDQRAALWTARRWKEKTQRAREVAPRRSAPRTSACANARARSGPQPACGTPSHCSHAKSARPASKSTQHRWHGVATDTSHVVHRPAERSRRLQLTSVHVPVCGQKGRSRTVIESAMNSSTCFPGRFESVHQSSGQPRIVHACDARTHSAWCGCGNWCAATLRRSSLEHAAHLGGRRVGNSSQCRQHQSTRAAVPARHTKRARIRILGASRFKHGAESQSATSGRACAEPVQLLAAPVERVITASRCGPSSLVARALRCKRGEPASSGVATERTFLCFDSSQPAKRRPEAGGRRRPEACHESLAFGVWRLPRKFGVWRLAFGVCHMVSSQVTGQFHHGIFEKATVIGVPRSGLAFSISVHSQTAARTLLPLNM